MNAFFLRRIGSLAVALFFASIAVFLLVRAVPGDPATLLLKNPTPERLAAIRTRLGLDRPLPVQYWRWMSSVIGRGSFGESIVTGRDVKEDLARTCHAHPTTAEAVKEAAMAVEKRAIHI